MKMAWLWMACVLGAGCSGGKVGGIPGLGGSSSSGDSGPTTIPRVTQVSAQGAGRQGKDLLIHVSGDDGDKDVSYLWVRFLNASGSAVAAFDLDHDGVLDTQGAAALDVSVLGQTTFTSSLRLPGAAPGVAQVVVALWDAAQNKSPQQTAPVTFQPEHALGDACDPSFTASRCAPSLGCRGTPPVCQEGLPPTLSHVAYLRGAAGPHILLDGTEPDWDLATMHIEFLSATEQPVMVDLDGDDIPDATFFDHDAQDAMSAVGDGTFFLPIQSADALAAQVPRIAVTAMDQAGHASARVKVSLTDVPLRSVGQRCDTRGFDQCVNAAVCSTLHSGTPTTCQNPTTARQTACTQAPVLDPAAGNTHVSGEVTQGSLWDAPKGCISGDPVGRPDSAVVLRLTRAAAVVTLSTALPGTNFDTVLYVYPACGADASPPLGCNDDLRGTAASTLVLNTLTAGSYMVVVDSFAATGGHFELSVTVQ